MISPLVAFLASELDSTIEEAKTVLFHGGAMIEPPAFDSPLRVDHLVGQTQYIAGVHLQDIRSRRLAGWIAEANDTRDAVIALRRATARGA